MTARLIAIAICLTAFITQAGAQGLTIELDGGLQGMQYPLSGGSVKLLPGGSLGLLYTIRLKGPLDLITGITGGVYRTQASLPNGTVFTNYQVDDEGSAFQYNMKAAGYKETQRFIAAGVPLLVQYQSTGAGTRWYLNAGGKIFFPSAASTQISAQQLTLSGYYPDYNINVSNLPQHGFGVLNNWKSTASTVLKPAAALSASTGFSFGLSGGMRLSIGLFVDYGLTALKNKSDSMPLVTYSPNGVSSIKGSSVLNMPGAGSAKLLAFGVQLRLTLGSAKPKPVARRKEAPILQPPAAIAEIKPYVPDTTSSIPPSPDTNTSKPPSPDTNTSKPPSPDTMAMTSSSPDTTAIAPSYYDSLGINYDEKILLEQPVIFGIVDEVVIPQVALAHLDKVAVLLLQHPKIRISLVGHICNSETETEDPKVASLRVRTVARYLESKGVRRNRIDVSALKESDPVQPNNPPANYRRRRVAVQIE
jgi:outer membrane protein OmpA-like peptidoglycan-associated protein